MLCRLYIDEVGNADLKNAPHDDNIRYLSLTGITTFRSFHDETIQPAIDRLKGDLFGHAQDTPVILHRREIIDRAGRYGVWHFDPYHYCMRCLVERFVRWLIRHDWTGDVVAETRYKKGDKKLKASFQRIWKDGTEFIGGSIVQERLTSREIKLFPKSLNCAGLQLCDLIAHPSFRAMKRARDGEQVPDDFGGKVAAILEDKKLARNPRSLAIDGWGRKWLP
jgi:uncharacterized protein DUF3800